MRAWYEAAQWIVMFALWGPFQAVERLCHVTGRAVGRVGELLCRPIYYGIVQAKRRRFGEPLWQYHDWQIGIAPPCAACGAPCGRPHADDCAMPPIQETR